MISVAQALSLPEGTTVVAVEGMLQVDGHREDKHREDGTPFTSQEFRLVEGDAQIAGTIYDHYPLDQYHGTRIVLASLKSRNGRFGGVTISKVSGGGSLFNRKPPVSVLRVSKAGGTHNLDTYAQLCATTKRPPQEFPSGKNK